jgi:hypothetical protein
MGPHEPTAKFAADPRWQLAERVMRSPHFSKSSRLCEFLTFVTEETLAGRGDQLNEQRIGTRVFERRVDYDAADDNIVRSHASRLRQRLETYFQHEGSAEPLRIELRRGSYIPVFAPAPAALEPADQLTGVRVSAISQEPLRKETTTDGSFSRRVIWNLLALVVLLLGVVSYQQLQYRRLMAAQNSSSPVMKRFWNQVLSAGRRNLIVPADSSLVLFENLTGKPVSLQEYLSRDYLAGSVNAPSNSVEASAKWIGHRRLTSVADIELATSLLRIPEVTSSSPEIRFARDLQLADLKEANVVLIGAEESDPWLSIFQSNLNFVISNDQKSTVFTVKNRSPRANEPVAYQYDPRDPKSKAYALIALRPNLSGDGHVLIVQGTGIAGTEAAADFLVDKAKLESVLAPVIGRSGRVPPFEILLETTNLNGSAPRSQVVAARFGN